MRSCPFLQPMKWRHSAMTSSVQKAATRSSNMIPQPPRQPKPLKHRSAHLTGWGLAASKKRNSAKAMSWPQKPVGMTSHSTSQKATISSQTRLPGSATRMWRAVTVQAHQPRGMLPAISRPICWGVNQCCSSRKDSQAHSVPTVPGAMRPSPEPSPMAMKWAGWDIMNSSVGRAMPPCGGPSGGRAAEAKVGVAGSPETSGRSGASLMGRDHKRGPGASLTLFDRQILRMADLVAGLEAGAGASGQRLLPGDHAVAVVPARGGRLRVVLGLHADLVIARDGCGVHHLQFDGAVMAVFHPGAPRDLGFGGCGLEAPNEEE